MNNPAANRRVILTKKLIGVAPISFLVSAKATIVGSLNLTPLEI
jgi:hypothetical protein